MLLPTNGATKGDEIVITPSHAPEGMTVERQSAGKLKVSVSAKKAATMKRGKWSAVLTTGRENEIAAVYRDIVTIGEERKLDIPKAETRLSDLLRSFAATLPNIELSMLNKQKSPSAM